MDPFCLFIVLLSRIPFVLLKTLERICRYLHARFNRLLSRSCDTDRDFILVSLQQMVLFGQHPSQGTLMKASQFLVGKLLIFY